MNILDEEFEAVIARRVIERLLEDDFEGAEKSIPEGEAYHDMRHAVRVLSVIYSVSPEAYLESKRCLIKDIGGTI